MKLLLAFQLFPAAGRAETQHSGTFVPCLHLRQETNVQQNLEEEAFYTLERDMGTVRANESHFLFVLLILAHKEELCKKQLTLLPVEEFTQFHITWEAQKEEDTWTSSCSFVPYEAANQKKWIMCTFIVWGEEENLVKNYVPRHNLILQRYISLH